ncbi:DUF2871 domain-containing protein [Demequina capsici]|uniref:DUF2871 domain-containing protein n=1 Tax=Demequina capsici TaxID=3075620 RepID=A0AA96FCD6_9MICO|nr:DUF2871 domain-containing protein [Demequina sp. PMTSA13]WNM27774.1 DUF2871 domain-containing protein [Demequina sp. PMTSA13]
MQRLFTAAFIYAIAGLGSGLYYRELTVANNFPEDGQTMLSGVHTHFLALGMIVLLVVLALDKLFRLSDSRLFGWFFWVYNVALVVTAGMMTWHGTLTVLGKESNAAIAGTAGLGHMAMTGAFILLFLALGKALKRDRRVGSEVAEASKTAVLAS